MGWACSVLVCIGLPLQVTLELIFQWRLLVTDLAALAVSTELLELLMWPAGS